MTARVDIKQNRAQQNWTLRENLWRVLWAAAWPLFRFSPRPCWGWRRGILRLFGAQVGAGAHIYPNVAVTMPWHLRIGEEAAVGAHAVLYALGRITIRPRATVSQYAHLCAGSHDWRDPARPLTRPAIVIGADAWVCADAFVGPGVTIGDGAILGARAVAMRDLAPSHIGQGNPMQVRVIT